MGEGGDGKTYNEVTGEDLQELGLETRAAGEDALQDADEHVAQRRADQGAVERHLGDARGEVVPVLVAVLRNVRGQELLQRRQRAGGKHLGAQRVGLELLEVGL